MIQAIETINKMHKPLVDRYQQLQTVIEPEDIRFHLNCSSIIKTLSIKQVFKEGIYVPTDNLHLRKYKRKRLKIPERKKMF